MGGFDETRALTYLHEEVNLGNIRSETELFALSLPQDTQEALAGGLQIERTLCEGLELGIVRYSLLGLMIVRNQAIIETVTVEALNSPEEYMKDLRVSIKDHVRELQTEVRSKCRPYFNVSRHVVDNHTDRHKKIGAMTGLIEGYLIANRQIAIENDANT